jgi:crossover junction endodeoxyribonuclease RuvC
MRILGIDPGTAILGWAVLDKEKSKIHIVAYNAIFTTPEFTDEQRLLILFTGYTKLLEEYSPDVISIEQLFFATNAKTAITVAQARGVILLASAKMNIPVVSYSPLQIKKTITGDGKADKRAIQFMLTKLLPIKVAPKPDDVADAVAIALTHAYTNRF